MSRPRAEPPAPIPLTVLTGFLGAGKTTILNNLLRDPALADTVVVVNEFGEIGLDHLLVETVEDGMVLLAAGCLCCTVRGDLVATLEDLLRRRDNGRISPFRRVIIETTGLADPIPVLSAVLYHPYLSLRYAVQGVVTAVDAITGAATLERHPEAVRQVAVADLVLMTKIDMLGAEAGVQSADLLERRLRVLAPEAAIRRKVGAAGEFGGLLPDTLFTVDGKMEDVRRWLDGEADAGAHDHGHGHGHAHSHGHHHQSHHHRSHHHDVSRHDERIHSVSLTADAPLPEAALDMFLGLVRERYGPKILRLKGIVDVVASPGRPVVIQGVQHVVHVPAVLPAWPDGDHRSRVVLIVDDVPREEITSLWSAMTGRPGIDQPDLAAITDNPLAPATMAR